MWVHHEQQIILFLPPQLTKKRPGNLDWIKCSEEKQVMFSPCSFYNLCPREVEEMTLPCVVMKVSKMGNRREWYGFRPVHRVASEETQYRGLSDLGCRGRLLCALTFLQTSLFEGSYPVCKTEVFARLRTLTEWFGYKCVVCVHYRS